MVELDWKFRNFNQLSTLELYQLMKLRVDVFVVEQACIYTELDGQDTQSDTQHLLGYIDSELIAYARAMGPDTTIPDVRIGRVVTHQSYRGRGVARSLMLQLLAHSQRQWPGNRIALSAQTPVTAFYESLGFKRASAEYVEDGIPHIDMYLDTLTVEKWNDT